MNIAASTRLGETAGRRNFELAGNVVLGPAQAGAVPFDVLEKSSQGGRPSENLLLPNAVDISELYWSTSCPERSWRWPLSYRSIEVLAIFVDALIIVSAGVLADAAYGLTITALPTEITIYGGAGAVVAALLTCVLKERGLYKPTALLNWTAQARSITI